VIFPDSRFEVYRVILAAPPRASSSDAIKEANTAWKPRKLAVGGGPALDAGSRGEM
jgi:hypothetical protein